MHVLKVTHQAGILAEPGVAKIALPRLLPGVRQSVTIQVHLLGEGLAADWTLERSQATMNVQVLGQVALLGKFLTTVVTGIFLLNTVNLAVPAAQA